MNKHEISIAIGKHVETNIGIERDKLMRVFNVNNKDMESIHRYFKNPEVGIFSQRFGCSGVRYYPIEYAEKHNLPKRVKGPGERKAKPNSEKSEPVETVIVNEYLTRHKIIDKLWKPSRLVV